MRDEVATMTISHMEDQVTQLNDVALEERVDLERGG